MDKVISFNVGGKPFAIRKECIDKYPNTFLYSLINNKESIKDNNGAFFIDRNPDMFSFILEYYRQDKIVYPNIVSESVFDRELDFYLIKELGVCDNSESIFPKLSKLYIVKIVTEVYNASKGKTSESNFCTYNSNNFLSPCDNYSSEYSNNSDISLYWKELLNMSCIFALSVSYIGKMGDLYYFIIPENEKVNRELIDLINLFSKAKVSKPTNFKLKNGNSYINNDITLIISNKFKKYQLKDGSVNIISTKLDLYPEFDKIQL